MLKSVVYHRHGQHLGYGLKFWPKETDNMQKAEEVFGWVRDCYK